MLCIVFILCMVMVLSIIIGRQVHSDPKNVCLTPSHCPFVIVTTISCIILAALGVFHTLIYLGR